MEIKHRVVILKNNSKYVALKKAFDDLGIKYEDKTGSIICLLSDNDQNYEKLKPKIYSPDVLVSTGMYYSQKDIEESEWLYINTSES